jgi:serine/threonine-protein kinase HipA
MPEGATGVLTLTYHDEWRDAPASLPLSLSLPLARRQHRGKLVEYYLRGLLPDDPRRLAQIAAHYGVPARDPFALLAHIGEDCPGAVQFARPDRLDALTREGPEEITWLTKTEFDREIASLRDQNAGRGEPNYEGEFSLPGALAKAALRWDPKRKRWGRPHGRAATTHIVKPPIGGLANHNDNEHLCLELARAIGLDAARSYVYRDAQTTALVVERYDRRIAEARVERIHQEDMSQALGADPDLKYARQGAPTLEQISKLLLEWSTEPVEDVLRLFRAVALNWVIVGTDAHPRNYSVIIGPGGDVRLAPLYDIASAVFLPKQREKIAPEERQLAMAVGGARTIANVTRASWESEARAAGVRPQRVLEVVGETVHAIIDAVDDVASGAAENGIPSRFADRFRAGITAEARRRLASL